LADTVRKFGSDNTTRINEIGKQLAPLRVPRKR
jgi:hypothetical protein